MIYLSRWIGVACGSVLYMIFGFIWYSPFLFGKRWLTLTGAKVESAAELIKPASIEFCTTLLLSYGIFYAVKSYGANTPLLGAKLGMLASIFFVTTTQIPLTIWLARPFELFLIDCSCYTIIFAMIGALAAVWK